MKVIIIVTDINEFNNYNLLNFELQNKNFYVYWLISNYFYRWMEKWYIDKLNIFNLYHNFSFILYT